MLLRPVLGFMLALAVMVGMIVISMPRDEPAPSAPSACDADRQTLLMSKVRAGQPAEVTPALFSEEPVGVLGYCSRDCSRCGSTAECRERGAGSCYNICP
ncbi:hypothetical protein MYSTI_05796 [Myxococcus stipitatus DSM 14675]|uniref:Uncharacterized protein n=1 Tax=Myxococcus stipitatus (strain DSM 14675 / JCM 12634 / Mx s8) TaxID=1278073 RepID=L7UHN1_MYXSD|nr:hypothetical protein [Myxococcus stipitatus]AGC47072.1 hypothetical protein MYSTI_05796 [Myxococcus stipitatus DSM 14675]